MRKIDSNKTRSRKEAIKNFHHLVTNQTDCIFCTKMQRNDRSSFCVLLIKALYTKYSNSQNYFYTRDINDYLDDRMTPPVLIIKDLDYYVDEEEYLKRWYHLRENTGKMLQLTEYYKYHKDIPRLFMLGICATIHKFHDKRRRLEYAKIKQQLGIQNDDRIQSESTTPHYQKKSDSKDCSVHQLQFMLKEINLSTKKTEQQSCTILLRDFLHSIIKNSGMDQSFDKSLTFAPNPIIQQLQKQTKKRNMPSIPQINIETINDQSRRVSPAMTPQLSPQISPQTQSNKQIPINHKLKQALLDSKKFNLGSATQREPVKQVTKNISPTAGYTSRSTTNQLQKLMMPFVQKQLEELKKRNKQLQKPKSQIQSPSTSRKISKDFITVPLQKKVTVPEINAHFVQPQFQGVLPLKSTTIQRSAQIKRTSQNSIRLLEPQSQPSSPQPQRPSQINIKLGKVRVPSLYTINQNNIVNIYFDEKMKKLVGQSKRGTPDNSTWQNLLKRQN